MNRHKAPSFGGFSHLDEAFIKMAEVKEAWEKAMVEQHKEQHWPSLPEFLKANPSRNWKYNEDGTFSIGPELPRLPTRPLPQLKQNLFGDWETDEEMRANAHKWAAGEKEKQHAQYAEDAKQNMKEEWEEEQRKKKQRH